MLRQWGQRMRLGCWVFTSNVDGQFQKAGFAEEQMHECHGSIHHLQCLQDCQSDVWSAAGFTPVVDNDTCRLLNDPPVCPPVSYTHLDVYKRQRLAAPKPVK